MYIYREGSGCSNINQPYDIISSEGRFSWSLDRNVTVPIQNYHHALGGSLPIFKIVSGSRYDGRDEYRKYVETNLFAQLLTDDVCSSESNGYSISWDDRGDGLDAFNLGYEEIFSPYSNPSSSSCNPDNTGLTIALLEQSSTTGTIIVKIYYNNNEDAITDLPPSKPKYQ